MKKRSFYALLLCATLTLAAGIVPTRSDPLSPDTAASLEEPYVFLDAWGGEIGMFNNPMSIAVRGEQVYVADTHNHRIQIFDVHGKSLMVFGGMGGDQGQFYQPHGIAVDGVGNIYVVDTVSHRVQKFDSDGTYVREWGSEGSGEGQFNYPRGIAVDGAGNVYVADTGCWTCQNPVGNHRIQKFDSEGNYLSQWGSEGSEAGQFLYPAGIAVDGAGNIYVADTHNHRVQKFDPDGSYLDQWGSFGSGEEQFDRPTGIAVDGEGNIYVADSNNHRIQKIQPQADDWVWTQWGSYGSGAEQFDRPSGIAAALDDDEGRWKVYVADTENHRVQKFTVGGDYLTQWGEPSSGQGQFANPGGIEVDDNRFVYVADSLNFCVQKFTTDGTYLTQWGSQGSGAGQFNAPCGIAADVVGNVYVADDDNHRVQKFDSEGGYVTQWGSYCFLQTGEGCTDPDGAGQFCRPRDIAVDGDGNVYVADAVNHRVQKFTAEGAYLTQWGSHCDLQAGTGCIDPDGDGPMALGDGQFYWPQGIAVAWDDDEERWEVYVVDSYNNRVQKFTTEGAYLTKWGSYGFGDGDFLKPQGIAVDDNEFVYVGDSLNFRVQKFTTDGTYLTRWGRPGNGEGQFYTPLGIAVDGAGNVYVADQGNQRVQKFAPAYPTPDPMHGLALNGSFEETPDLIRWAYGGELPVTQVPTAILGTRAVRLGEPVPQQEQPRGMAWLRQTMYIRPEWDRPILTFRYRMFVNDILHYSDFHVWLTRTDGGFLAEILRDGFRSCQGNVPPPAGYDLGWRTASYDLSAFKGQNVRLVFENRNIHDISWGIWTILDDVRVVDAGPRPAPPGPHHTYLPLVSALRCDPVVTTQGFESLDRPERPSKN